MSIRTSSRGAIASARRTTGSGGTGGGSLPAPTDLGNNLSSYMSQSGGQTIVIPAGKTLSGGDFSGYTHSDWLILLAETPGSVTVSGLTRFLNCSKVILGGIKFDGSVYPAQGTTRFVLWYCDITGTSGTAGLNVISYSGGSPGDYIWAMGTNIHDCDHDGMKAEADYVRFQGGRMWGIHDPAGVNHDDCYQSRKGLNQEVLDFVFSQKPDGTAGSTNGHTMLSSDLNAVSIEMARGWVTNSGNYPITADYYSPNSLTATVHDIYAWNNNYNTQLVYGDGTVNNTGNTSLSAPPGGTTAPDLLWQSNNPYESAESWLSSSGL